MQMFDGTQGTAQCCCGVDCAACRLYPDTCAGCDALEGKAFWIGFTGGEICDIYRCCAQEKALSRCEACEEYPCAHYAQEKAAQAGGQSGRTRNCRMLRSVT